MANVVVIGVRREAGHPNYGESDWSESGGPTQRDADVAGVEAVTVALNVYATTSHNADPWPDNADLWGSHGNVTSQ